MSGEGDALGSAARWSIDRPELVHEEDRIACEEPLQIQVDGERYGIVMRTPGHDLELVSGLLFAEGIIQGPQDVAAIGHCRLSDGALDPNTVLVRRPESSRAPWPSRSAISSTACGVCGRESIDDLSRRAPTIASGPQVSTADLAALPDQLRKEQSLFDTTGGTHAAGIFGVDGRSWVVREDVGRHNAVDKVVGAALRHQLVPLSTSILVVSGRVSFEIVQKARMAGIPILVAVSAPTTLAIDLALEGGQTLIGFARTNTLKVYTGEERVR